MVAARICAILMLSIGAVIVSGCGGSKHVADAKSQVGHDAGVIRICERVRTELAKDVHREVNPGADATLAAIYRAAKKEYESQLVAGGKILDRAATELDRTPPSEQRARGLALRKVEEHRSGIKTVEQEVHAHERLNPTEEWAQRVYEFLLGCSERRRSSDG